MTLVVMSHPLRRERARRLAGELGGAVVSLDPGPYEVPSALRSHRAALTMGVERHAGRYGHVVVVQDDAVPLVQGVARHVEQVLERPGNEDRLVSFYVGSGHVCRRAYAQSARLGRRYHELPVAHFVPTVCVAWPITLAGEWLAWLSARPAGWLAACPWDDEAIGEWRRDAQRAPGAVATIPSLFGHDNLAGSLMGHEKHGNRHPITPLSVYARGDWRRGW